MGCEKYTLLKSFTNMYPHSLANLLELLNNIDIRKDCDTLISALSPTPLTASCALRISHNAIGGVQCRNNVLNWTFILLQA